MIIWWSLLLVFFSKPHSNLLSHSCIPLTLKNILTFLFISPTPHLSFYVQAFVVTFFQTSQTLSLAARCGLWARQCVFVVPLGHCIAAVYLWGKMLVMVFSIWWHHWDTYIAYQCHSEELRPHQSFYCSWLLVLQSCCRVGKGEPHLTAVAFFEQLY